MPNQHTTPIPLEERFWPKVDKSGDCWLWAAGKYPNGYGQFWTVGGSHNAHHIAWELVCGPVPDGMVVCHACDCRACVRNDEEGWYEINGVLRPRRGHLWLGTNAENSADMVAKGRQNTQSGDRAWNRLDPSRVTRGERVSSAKLTEADVRDIRRRHVFWKVTYLSLAREYGVSPGCIGDIVRRTNWGHVED